MAASKKRNQFVQVASPPKYIFRFNLPVGWRKWLSSIYIIYWLCNAPQKLFNQCVNFDGINPFQQDSQSFHFDHTLSLWLQCQIIPFYLLFLYTGSQNCFIITFTNYEAEQPFYALLFLRFTLVNGFTSVLMVYQHVYVRSISFKFFMDTEKT